MILAFDVGNTNITIGCIDYNKKIHFVSRLSTDIYKSEDEYAIDLKNILDLYKINIKDIDGSIISSVVPPLITVHKNAVKKITGKKPIIVDDKMDLNFKIALDKDVDGFTSLNMGRMLKGEECFIPCTPKGILTILSYFGVSTIGKRVTVIGRSDIVGKPMAVLLMGKGYDATVSVANSKTKDLRSLTLSSDIVISAVGKPMILDSSYFSDGTVIIDVGINRIIDSTRKRGWRTVGDVDRESIADRDVSYTPVPGGVGLMTVASLMENTFISRERRG